MFTKSKVLPLVLFFLASWLRSQELPPIQNFTPADYQAENQNWSIDQASDGLMYMANNQGLLEYNGARWKVYPTPNKTIMRSVKVVDDRIYTGFYMDYGYWEKDAYGVLQYTSLSTQLKVGLLEDEQFWDIVRLDGWIVFQSLNRIHIYDTEKHSVHTISSDSTILKMYLVGNHIYFQRDKEGIYRLENGADVLVSDSPIVKENVVVNIFRQDDRLLLHTRDDGFYFLNSDGLERWDIPANDQLSKVSIYNSIRLADNGFALGTIADGLFYLDENGVPIYQIYQENGLLNNTVLALHEDRDQNIWMGLDNGISYANIQAPFAIYQDKSGVLGSVYSAAEFRGKMYLGTNHGLFYRNLDEVGDFSFVPGTQGQVWFLEVLNDTLFCGHHLGTFTVEADNVQSISAIPGTWTIKTIDNAPNLLLQGSYDGLYVLEDFYNGWRVRNKISGFSNSSRFIEKLGDEIFVNHEYKGVYKIKVDDDLTTAFEVSIDSIEKSAHSSIAMFNDTLYYAYNKGVFKYDPSTKEFANDSLLSGVYEKGVYSSGKLILDRENRLWMFTNSDMAYVTPGGLTQTPDIKYVKLSKEKRDDVIGYENIIKLSNQERYLVGTSTGYLIIDLDQLKVPDFEVQIDNISYAEMNHEMSNMKLFTPKEDVELKSSQNNVQFSFHTPTFDTFLKPSYQFQLEGMYEEWSLWSTAPQEYFKNLPPGSYTFNVRAKMGDKVSSNIASYSFEIEKPWYLSTSMIILYILAGLIGSLLVHGRYRSYYHKQQDKLIERNKKELQLVRIQNERQLMKVKNKKLKKDVKAKGKELAASTLSMVKKNQLLVDVKEGLSDFKDNPPVKSVITMINKNLNQKDDWEFFKEAFKNADSKFFKKIKTLHPDLSPNDLRLCAYLRLNLSSKEIAPLLNISPRSVEIKRYRLRKKMNLPHEKNLVNYILEI